MQFHLNLLIHLCRVHFNQFFRLLAEIGIARIIILSIIGLIFLFQLLPFIPFSSIWAFFIPLIPALFFATVFSSGKSNAPNENDFLISLGATPYWIRFLRNSLFALPLLLILVLIGNFKATALSVPILFFLSLDLKSEFRTGEIINFRIAHLALLPWTIALRKGFIVYVLIILLAACQVIHISFVFFAIFILHLRILSLLQYNESQMLIQAFGKNAHAFLNYYLKKHLYYYLLSGVPLLILTAVLSIEVFPILFGIFILLTVHQCLSIYLKFSFYEPGKDNSDMQSLQSIMLAFLLIPFTIPIPFIYLWRYRKRAILNLNSYL